MSFDVVTGIRPRLTLFTSLTVAKDAAGLLYLDERFVSGMTLHARNWSGPVTAVLREGKLEDGVSSRGYHPDDLEFSVHILPAGAPPESALVSEPGVVMALAHAADHLPLARAARRLGLGVVLGIDQPLSMRLMGSMRDRGQGLLRRLYSAGWNLRQERAIRRAMREADGVQMNGFPASQDYLGLNRNAIRYLDNRMRADMLANADDMARRRESLRRGQPLRLVHSGRLERHLGAHHLISLALALKAAEVPFSLAIEGRGGLESDIRNAIADRGLAGQVTCLSQLPFEDGLVPLLRDGADLLISCRSRPDTTAVFVEGMACGLPVLGFDNRMLSPLIRDSAGGWTVPIHDISRMVARIQDVSTHRDKLMQASQAALDYARRHSCEAEFGLRNKHLQDVFVRTRPEPFVLGEQLRRHARAGL